ncbi:MAG: hypothetical protein HY718_12805 [Planctomycetes bacterium]|nr:hypothetical protein [Planctomycetota bacterium]
MEIRELGGSGTRYVSDLQEGEQLGPLQFCLTPQLLEWYLDGIGELDNPLFRSDGAPCPTVAPPTMVHVAKVKLLHHHFPAGAGPHARMHYRFDNRAHSVARVGEMLTVSGSCTRRYIKRDRPYVDLELLVRGEDGRLIWEYHDTSLLRLAVHGGAHAD